MDNVKRYDPERTAHEARYLARQEINRELLVALERVHAAMLTFRVCIWCQTPGDDFDSGHTSTCWVPQVEAAVRRAQAELDERVEAATQHARGIEGEHARRNEGKHA